MKCGFSNVFQFVFTMAITRGSGSGAVVPEKTWLTDDEVHEMITTQVTMEVKEVILEIFGSIKTIIIDLFDK